MDYAISSKLGVQIDFVIFFVTMYFSMNRVLEAIFCLSEVNVLIIIVIIIIWTVLSLKPRPEVDFRRV